MTPKQLLTADLNNAAETLRASSTDFAIATVVRTLNATSAKQLCPEAFVSLRR